ncbi:sensor histidine kinase [Litchfieldia salsa]|uniref:histidine kinase n=1 Tax=Litchfieldia salsa TaxID=930152 RepID=A0A1H0Q244_9BACI|nr:histidine kinase [Litchfieldia salsa]SDP10738.1 Histidine kinase-, DNA gyrase B-, and HSP90-like ATPase [Litchfieldia salsa]
MIRIRTKLLLYFGVILLLVNGVIYYLYDSSENIMDEYDSSFHRFLLLKEISQQTNEMTEYVNGFIVEKDQVFINEYKENLYALQENKIRLSLEVENENNYVILRNYQNMIESFVKECESTIKAFEQGNIDQYSYHYNQSVKISGFILESTLSLINSELTDYQNFYDELSHRNSNYQLMGIFLVVSIFIFCTLLAILISRGITKPIHKLALAAEEISIGKFSGEDIKTNSNDELKLLTETFNEMRKNIRDLVIEIKEQSELDTLLKELELKSLQNQINPHFLFNTLNIIAKLAYLEDANQTSKLIESVSFLLRYNLADLEKPTTLRDEIKLVEEYFTIQQTRFSDRIVFEMDIDDQCVYQLIPRMTLQPIIENAFIHGLEDYEEGARLLLTIYQKQGRTIIDIIDNGVGMDEQTRQKLLNSLNNEEETGKDVHKSGHSTGIGIKNVIKRLEIYFKHKEMVEIESELGKGTLFRIKLPMTN